MKKLLFNLFSDRPTLLTITISATLVVLIVLIAGGLLGAMTAVNWSLGVNGFGPEQQLTVSVQRLYVDSTKEGSSYIVGTDKGVYEIANILIPVQIFNADELYSKLEVGKTYDITAKGNKVLNPFIQQYPYIIKID